MRRVQPTSGRSVIATGLLTTVVLAVAALATLPSTLMSAQTVIAETARQGSPLLPGAGIESITLATRTLNEVPSGRRWVLRRRHPLNEDAHAHAPGFVYAATGSSYLVVEDSQGALMPEGRAAWAPGGIGHLHSTQFRASNREQAANTAEVEIWTILLERETEARKPGAAATSPPLRGLQTGLYEARLVARTFQPGAATDLLSRTGPELAYTLSGFWELEYFGVTFSLGASQGYLADPGVPHRLRNIGDAPVRLLSAQLVPAGQPADVPSPPPNP